MEPVELVGIYYDGQLNKQTPTIVDGTVMEEIREGHGG